jgi:hypothetical protein
MYLFSVASYGDSKHWKDEWFLTFIVQAQAI